MKENIELSIIIVNYNGGNYLEECLISVYTKCQSLNFEVIVFDNDSSDKSLDFLDDNFLDVITIRNDKNIGFAGANNKAASIAKGAFLLLLNNDTVLLNNFDHIFSIFESDTDLGAVGIKMLNTQKQYVSSCGKFPTPLGLIKLSGLNYKTKPFITGNFEGHTHVQVDWISGAFLLTKKEYWQALNGLDEDYFMYVEDVDFCKKLQSIGKKIIFIPSLSYVHHIGFNFNREKSLIKGYFLYATKHFNKFEEIIAKFSLSLNYAFKKIFKNLH